MYSLIENLLKRENDRDNDVKLTKLSKIRFSQLKYYVGQEAYDKDGRIIGIIRRIVAIDGSKALYVEVDVNGCRKKLKASRTYVLLERVSGVSNVSAASNALDRTSRASSQVASLNELMYKLLLINNSEIEVDMKYARGLMSHETYIKVKKELANKRECLVKGSLSQIENVVDFLRTSHEGRELIMALLTYAKIYLFGGDSVSRQS